MKPVWLNRDLIAGPYHILCLSKAEYKAEMRKMGVKGRLPAWVNAGADATVHYLTKRATRAAIVCLRVSGKHEPSQIAGMLVHEAVHIWQEFRESIGETKPSHEFEAYCVQRIAQNLIHEYGRRLQG